MTHFFSKTKVLVLLALSAVTLVSVGKGQQAADAPPVHPNFSGRWRMVKEKSDFNGFKAPDAVIRVVDHRGQMINLHTIQTVSALKSTIFTCFTSPLTGANIFNLPIFVFLPLVLLPVNDMPHWPGLNWSCVKAVCDKEKYESV